MNIRHQHCLVSNAVVSAKVSKDKDDRQQEQQVKVMKRRQKTVRFTHHHHLRQKFANQTTDHLLNLNQEDDKTNYRQTPFMGITRPLSHQQILKMMTLLVAAHIMLLSSSAAAAGSSLPVVRAAHLSGDVATNRGSAANGAQLQHHRQQQQPLPPKQRVSSHNDLLNQHHQQLARVIAMMSDVSDAEATTADKVVASQQAPSPPPPQQVNQKQQQQQVEQQVNHRQVNQQHQQRSAPTASQQKLIQTDNGHGVGTKSAAARLSSAQNLLTGSVQVSNAPGARFARLETQDQTNSDDQSGFDINAEAPVSVGHSHQSAGAHGYNQFQPPNQHLRLQQQPQQQHKLRFESSAAAADQRAAVAAAQQEQFARHSSPAAEPAAELPQSYSSPPEERLVDEAADFAAQVSNREKARTANIKVVFNNNPRFIIGAGSHLEASMIHQDYVPLMRRTRQPAAHLYNDDYYSDASSVNETSIRAPANLEEPPCDRKEKAALKATDASDSASVELVEPSAQSLAPKSPTPPPPPPLSTPVQSVVPAKRQLNDKLTGSPLDEQQQVVDTPLEQIVRSGLRPPLRMVISMRNKHGELMKVPVNLHGSMPGAGEAPMQLHLEQVDERKLSAKQVKLDSIGSDNDDSTPPGGDFFDPSFSKPFAKQFNSQLSGNNRLQQVTPKPDCAGKENEESLGAGAGESMSGNANLQLPSMMSPFNQSNKTLASMFELLSRQMLSSLSQQVSQQQQQQQVPAQMSQQQVAQQFSPQITQMLPASQQMAAQLAQISQRIPQLPQITQQQQQVFNQQPQQAFNQQQVVNQFNQQQQQDEQEDLTVAMMTANMSNAAPFEERQVSMTVIKPPAGTTIEEAIQAHAQVDSPPRTVAILSKGRPLETIAHLGGGAARGVSTAAAAPVEEAVPVPVEVQLRKAPGTPTIELPETMANVDPDGFSSGSDLIYSTSAGDANGGRYRRSADAPSETLEPSDRIANQPRNPRDAFQLRAATEAREQSIDDSPTGAKDDTIEAAASEDSHDEEEPSDEEMVDTADSNDEAAAAAPVDSEGDEYGASDMADDQDDASAFDGDDEPYNQGASSERDYNSPSFEIPKIDINPAALKQNGCRTVLREVQEIPMNGLGVVQADGRAGSGYQHSSGGDRAAAGSVPSRSQLPGVRVRRHANDNLINSRKVTSIVMTKECHFPNDSSGSSSSSGSPKSQPSLARQRSVAPVSLESQSPVASDEATQQTTIADKLPVASGQTLSATQLTHPFGRKFPQKAQDRKGPVNDPRFGQSQPDKSLFEPNVAQYPLNSANQHQLIVNPQFGQHNQETKVPAMVALGYAAPALQGYHQQPQLTMAASERRPLTLIGNSLIPQSPVLAHPKPQLALNPLQPKQIQSQPQPHIKRRSATPTRSDLNAAAATPQMRRREDVVAQKLYKPPSAQDPFHTLSYSSSNGVDPDPDDRDERDESTGSSPSTRDDVDRSSAPSTKYSSETLSERERDALLDPNYDDTDPAEPKRRKRRPQNKQRAMSSASNDDESRAPQELDDLDDAADDFAGDESRLSRSRSSPVNSQNEQQQQYPMMQQPPIRPRNHHNHHNQQPAAMRRQSQPLPEEPLRFGKSFRFEHERGRPQARGLMAQLSQLPAQQSFVSESTNNQHHQGRHNRAPAAKHRHHQPPVIERRREQEDPDERDDDDDEDEPQSAADRPVATMRSKKTIRTQKRQPADEDEPDADPEYNPKEVHLPAHSKPKKIQKSFAYVHRDLPQKGDPKSNDDDFVLSYGRGNLQTEQEDYDSDRDNQHQPNGNADNSDDAQQQQQQAASKLQPQHSTPMSSSLSLSSKPLSTTN